MSKSENQAVVLNGSSLTIEQVVAVARDPAMKVSIDPRALERVRQGRQQIEDAVNQYHEALADPSKAVTHVYGVTTGFGEFKNEPVPPEQLIQLQKNILISHAAGAGDNVNATDPANYFSAEVIRATLVLRLNTLLKGFSGVRVELVSFIADMINRGIVPLVPTRGSVGSSGDLCPLAHLFVVALGFGQFYIVKDSASIARPFKAEEVREASTLSETLTPVAPSYKEGLALTNGATFSAALLALAVHDAENLANLADLTTAMSLEAICGRTRAFDEAIHEARNMTGQRESAANLRALLAGSDLTDRARSLQDSYSIRCSPQVHGATRDAIAYAKSIAIAEMNAATDNPLFFPELDRRPYDVQSRLKRGDDPSELGDERAFSAGNFHGQPIALAADFLAIAAAELADISERRIQLLLDKNHNRNLPANLISRRGVNSGLMLTQYTAAGIVSENKVLAHPSSVDSIPTSGGSEDHNSMATYSARKLRTVVNNVEAVLAINLLAAAQALDWRVGLDISPNATTLTRNEIGVLTDKLEAAEKEAIAFEASISVEKVGKRLAPATRAAYCAIRSASATIVRDRILEPEIRAVRILIVDGALLRAVNDALPSAFAPIRPMR